MGREHRREEAIKEEIVREGRKMKEIAARVK